MEKSRGSSSRSVKRKDKSAKHKSTSAKPSSRRHKGHVADNNPSDADSDSGSSGTDSSESDEETIEVAAHSKDLGEVTPSQWISDTGATAYITNQRQLFRLLTPVKRRTIKVGEGKLYL